MRRRPRGRQVPGTQSVSGRGPASVGIRQPGGAILHQRSPLRANGMRNHNSALVLSTIAGSHQIHRARLATETGLTKSSVSLIVRELLDARILLEETQIRHGKPGRPGTVVRLNRDGFAGLGLAVGVRSLSACVVDLGHRVRVRHTRDVDNRTAGPEDVLADLSSVAALTMADARSLDLTIVGCGVAVPGPVDETGGILRHAPNLGWRNLAVLEVLRAALSDLVADHFDTLAVENEAHFAAFGELWFGCGRTLGDYVQVFGDIGVGGAIVANGDVSRGSAGLAGELGHVVVDPNGRRCGCGGRGCLETVAGLSAMARSAGISEQHATATRCSLTQLLVEALRRRDRRALAAARDAGRALGRALASVVNVVDRIRS